MAPATNGGSEVNQTVALRDILTELRHGCSAVRSCNIPAAQMSCYRRDDFHASDGGQIKMISRGRIEEGPHPRRPMLLDIALD